MLQEKKLKIINLLQNVQNEFCNDGEKILNDEELKINFHIEEAIKKTEELFNSQTKKLQKNLDISFEYGFCINSNQVDEFIYLFDFTLKNANLEKIYLDLEDFKIKENEEIILKEINIELAKDILREEEFSNLDHKTAIENMKNLKQIIEVICTYQKQLENL